MRLKPGEPDLEALWSITLAAAAAIALGWLLLRLPTPLCPFHLLTGIPCPSCGGTRCVRNLLEGNLAVAFWWNPLVLIGVFVAAIYGIYATAVTLLRLPRVRLADLTPAQAWFLRIGAVALFAANWIYLIRHFARLA